VPPLVRSCRAWPEVAPPGYSGSSGSAFRIPSVAWKPAPQASHKAMTLSTFRFSVLSKKKKNVMIPHVTTTAKVMVQNHIQKAPLPSRCLQRPGAGP